MEPNDEQFESAGSEPEDSLDVTPEQLLTDVKNFVKSHPPDKMLVILIKDMAGDRVNMMRFNSGCSNAEALGYLEMWKAELLCDINMDEDEDDPWNTGGLDPA